MKLTWISDLHLDTLGIRWRDPRDPATKLKEFITRCRKASEASDALLVTGDIANGHLTDDYFAIVAGAFGKPVFFVLGNHDYYGAGFQGTRDRILEHMSKHPNLVWLNEVEVVKLTGSKVLVGHDCWYDGQGDRAAISSHHAPDWSAEGGIPELYYAVLESRQALNDLCLARAKEGSEILERRIRESAPDSDAVFIATHVPPFEEASRYKGRPSPQTSMPYYSNKELGRRILKIAQDFPDTEFTVLCGHTHNRADWYGTDLGCPNLFVRTTVGTYGDVPDPTHPRCQIEVP